MSPTGRAGAAGGSVSIALADAPAAPRDPRAAFYVTDHVAPGTTLDRAVRLSNTGTDPVTLELYVGGSSVADGRLQFGDRAGDTSDLARWTSVTPSRVTVPPGGSADAKVSIAVPEDADGGERLGVVWAQTPAAGTGTSIVNRVGVRIYLSVGSGTAPSTDFRVDALTASRDATGAPVLTASITNTGGRVIEPTGTVRVDERAGVVAPIAPGLALLPRQHGDAAARLTDDVRGQVPVAVVISANGIERRVDATVTFPTASGAVAPPVDVAGGGSGNDASRAVPAIAAALLAAAALVGVVRTRQRRA